MPMNRSTIRNAAAVLSVLVLTACGTTPQKSSNVPLPPSGGKVKVPVRQDPTLPALPAAGSGRGGYYKDDGPGDNPPANLRDVPDAEVRNEPYSTRANRRYVVFGKTYTPMTDNQPFTQRGTGTWYGKKFHGQRTSSGEIYDMYKMTAAHPTLPIPSYARLTNLISGAQVIVRINDRGPFHPNRAIDVSYTAALKLGLLSKGSHELKIDRILPDEVDSILAERASAPLRSKLTSAQTSSPVQPLVLTPKAVPRTGLNAMPLYASIAPSAPAVSAPLPGPSAASPSPSSTASPSATASAAPAAAIEALMLADRAPSAAAGALVPVSASPAA